MRIGILTFHFSDNFGALLQAYGLRRWLVDRGHDVSFINYCPLHVEQGGSFILSMRPAAFKANAKVLYLKLSSAVHKLIGRSEQAAKFRDFRAKYLGVSDPRVESVDQLAAGAVLFDLIIAGSDQIWSPSVQRGFDPVYFLSFAVDSGARRISYAASFGKDSFSAEHLAAAGTLLDSLSAISVREMTGVEIVNSAAGRIAACVPDPTLLHTGYEELLIAAGDQREGHVFCYALRSADGIREVARSVSNATGAPIISPYNIHRRWREIGTTVHPGPAEWLSQLANARFVVTNSFHGTVFSVIFRKPFLVVGLPGAKATLNARSRNLLSQLGLMDRFLDFSEIGRAHELVDAPIDWESVAVRQSGLREAGTRFLEREMAEVGVR